jgi:hypothetical protein
MISNDSASVSMTAFERKAHLLEEGHRLRLSSLDAQRQVRVAYAENPVIRVTDGLIKQVLIPAVPVLLYKTGRLAVSIGFFLVRKQPLGLAILLSGAVMAMVLKEKLKR